ncbi:MAG: cytochrome c [Gammaproteobacteria bacterium]|nr:cytochrome c [Gammaproteobacteria bacterium]
MAASTNGKDLHDANCQSCHASLMNGSPDSIYTRPDRKVTTVDGLRKQVSRCKTTVGVNWPEDKVQEVVDYLNTNFYKL